MVPTLNIFFQSCTLNDFYQECMIEKKYWILPLVVFTLIFFFNHILLIKTIFSICWIIFKLMNVNHAWLWKSIEKYHSWLWYHSKNIEFITRGLRPLVINSIFFLVITITTRDIFQYFLTKRPGVYAYPEPTSLAPLYICVWLHYISI